MTKLIIAAALVATAANFAVAQNKPHEVVIDGVAGFQDTPMQPDGKWHVHDPARPQPPVVTPGSFSENATPPSDADLIVRGLKNAPVRKLLMVDGGSGARGDPCEPWHWHGYVGMEQEAVDDIVAFVKNPQP